MAEQNPQAMGNLYDPVGALGGQFAPAHIPGSAQSQEALTNWGKGRGLSYGDIDALRMPLDYSTQNTNSNPYAMFGGGGAYGNQISSNIGFGDNRGMVDPNALLAASQHKPYDIGARRDAIAQRVAANQQAQAAQQQQQQPYQYPINGQAPGVPYLYNNIGTQGG
jgi:hypothetical protein